MKLLVFDLLPVAILKISEIVNFVVHCNILPSRSMKQNLNTTISKKYMPSLSILKIEAMQLRRIHIIIMHLYSNCSNTKMVTI